MALARGSNALTWHLVTGLLFFGLARALNYTLVTGLLFFWTCSSSKLHFSDRTPVFWTCSGSKSHFSDRTPISWTCSGSKSHFSDWSSLFTRTLGTKRASNSRHSTYWGPFFFMLILKFYSFLCMVLQPYLLLAYFGMLNGIQLNVLHLITQISKRFHPMYAH